MRDKQIEEMAKIIDGYCEAECLDGCYSCVPYKNAEKLYNAGYRKASDVAEEIADFIWEKDITDTLLPINGRYLSKQDFIAELKKKYEREEK